MMPIIHVTSERNEANGMYRVAMYLAEEQRRQGYDASVMTCAEFLAAADFGLDCEVWVHGCWLPCEWKCCLKVLKQRKNDSHCSLIRMTHGSLSPVYLERQSKWKKRLVSPIERWLFAKCDRVVVTCAEERKWCEGWGVKGPFEMTDLKRFFKLNTRVVRPRRNRCGEPLHVLYLGREHPLKGVSCFEMAVRELNDWARTRVPKCPQEGVVVLKKVSAAFGDELEKIWDWCDVLCLPTLSENFGLVVAEAIEHGRSVITTDGAPAWDPDKADGESGWKENVRYLRGYREGSDRQRIELLKNALMDFID